MNTKNFPNQNLDGKKLVPLLFNMELSTFPNQGLGSNGENFRLPTLKLAKTSALDIPFPFK